MVGAPATEKLKPFDCGGWKAVELLVPLVPFAKENPEFKLAGCEAPNVRPVRPVGLAILTTRINEAIFENFVVNHAIHLSVIVKFSAQRVSTLEYSVGRHQTLKYLPIPI